MDVFEKAIEFAVKAHSGAVRKNGNVPFILHPMEVAAIAGTMTSDRETLAAAVLHDTVEDADVSGEEIESNFGKRVASLVASETENKRREMPPSESWTARKEESLAVLKGSKDRNVKISWLSDKLANVRSFVREKQQRGNASWLDFNQKDVSKQAWYYRTIAEYTKELCETDAWREYAALVNKLFEGV